MKAKEIRFTGGDNLTGLARKAHEVLAQTELNDGKGAYALSFAGGNSGFSFGGNQMDMGVPPAKIDDVKTGDVEQEAIKVFKQIIEGARDETGQQIVDPVLHKKLFNDAKCMVKGQRLEDVFDAPELDKINAALSSDYGMRVINDEYVKEINTRLAYVNSVIEASKVEELKSDEWRIRLLDYHNQLNIEKNSRLIRFLKGEVVTLHSGQQKFKKEISMLENYHNFFRATKEYAQRETAMENRWNKREGVLAAQAKRDETFSKTQDAIRSVESMIARFSGNVSPDFIKVCDNATKSCNELKTMCAAPGISMEMQGLCREMSAKCDSVVRQCTSLNVNAVPIPSGVDKVGVLDAVGPAYVQFDKFGSPSVHFNADNIGGLLNIPNFVIPGLLGGIGKSRL